MSLMKLPLIIGRIKTASHHSRIAVFRCLQPGLLDAVFADTIETQRIIVAGTVTFIGAYHGDNDLVAVRRLLESQIVAEQT